MFHNQVVPIEETIASALLELLNSLKVEYDTYGFGNIITNSFSESLDSYSSFFKWLIVG